MSNWADLTNSKRIKGGEAHAVLTAWRSMISPLPQEYDQVAREIEKAGGFLHVKDSARGDQGPARSASRSNGTAGPNTS